jgi:hypothetical protein
LQLFFYTERRSLKNAGAPPLLPVVFQNSYREMADFSSFSSFFKTLKIDFFNAVGKIISLFYDFVPIPVVIRIIESLDLTGMNKTD